MAARGWAWTAYDWDEGRLFNYIGDAQNTFPVWNATPLVALDVYEHAYFLDYQTDRASYIEAFFGEPRLGRRRTTGSAATRSRRDRARARDRRRLPRGLDPVGVLARPPLQARGHPQARQREHRRDERLADVRPRGTACRSSCSTRRRDSCRRSSSRSRSRRSRACSPARARCSATHGRCSSASRRAGRWSRRRAAPSSASRRSSRRVGAVVWIVVFLLTRYASVASIAAAVSLPRSPRPARLLVAGRRLRRRSPPAAVAVPAPREREAAARGEESRFRLRRPARGEPSSGPTIRAQNARAAACAAARLDSRARRIAYRSRNVAENVPPLSTLTLPAAANVRDRARALVDERAALRSPTGSSRGPVTGYDVGHHRVP